MKNIEEIYRKKERELENTVLELKNEI